MKVLFLLGMPTSGKTTIGHAISKLLKCQFIDIDEKIASDVGMSVRSFYAKYGKIAFQQMEYEVLKEVLVQCEREEFASNKRECIVISVGGGFIENNDAINYLVLFRSSLCVRTHVFFLDVPVKILWKRLLNKIKKEKTIPAFLKTKNVDFEGVIRLKSLFLSLYRKRILLFQESMMQLALIKIKCKGKKVKQIAKMALQYL